MDTVPMAVVDEVRHEVTAQLRPRTGVELRVLLQAERAELPFLVYRDGCENHVVLQLEPDPPLLTLGRHRGCHVALPWDDRVSAAHALLARLGSRWTIADDRISLNGTFVNGHRLRWRQRLADGDAIRVGVTLIVFRHTAETTTSDTVDQLAIVSIALTPMQRKVLVALCRPFASGARHATPASNVEIAAELFVTVDAVKTHMRKLFERFSVGALPQNQKRAKVVERAFEAGIITERDL